MTLLLCAAAIVLAVFLRFDQLGAPCYWLDEILGDTLTTNAARAPWWRWIAGFEPEHGPLYYATQLASRIFGRSEFAGRFVPALCGVAAVVVAALIARKIGERATGIFAVAAVTAMSPLHVYFSREARPYGLVLLLATIALLLLIDGKSLAGFAATLVALLYTSAVAGPLVAALAVTALLAGKRYWRFAAVSGVALALFPLLYRGPRVPSNDPVRKLDFSLFADVTRAFSASAMNSPVRPATLTAIVAFAVIGAIAIARRNRRTAAILVALTLLPPLFAIASLQLIGHWFAIRYVIAGLPAFLVLTGAGIAALTSLAGVAELGFTAVIVAALAFELIPIARREPALKVDWRSLAATLKTHAKPGDVIIAGQMWSGASMAYYLHDLPPGVRFMGLFDVKGASSELQKARAGWLISAGPGYNPVRDWMCRYPVVASSELEDLRVHFAPSVSDFVRHANAEEMRAASFGAGGDVILDVGNRDDLLLGGKWGSREGGANDRFRWVIDRAVSITFPIHGARTRTITVTAMPVTHPKLGPQQMTLSLNGNVVGAVTMHGFLADYTLTAPAQLWRDGVNVLAFTFSRATTPASLIPGSTDQRTLAAAIHRVIIGDPAHARAPVYVPRLASASLLGLRCASRDTRTEFDRRHYNRAGVEALLARLGFDPVESWPHVASGEYTIEQIANTAAFDNSCTDSGTFVENAFATLLARPPNSVERRDLAARMRTGTTRSRIVALVLRDDGFRESVVRAAPEAARDRR
ncbi:MAG TPA: glycosyltransferase family 39 protein [Thermoanaerobaculia bacterium]